MKIRILFLAALLSVCAVFFTACGAESNKAEEFGVVPGTLQTMEAAAEDIIDLAPGGNWEQIGADVMDIANAWKAYQPQAGRDGASQDVQTQMSTSLEELQFASTAKDAAAVMQSSNDVSAAVMELYALYNPIIPADIGRLDVLERQVILDVAAKNYPAAEASLTKTKEVWETVKSSVLEHGGGNVVDEFEVSLAAQESALKDVDDATVINEAGIGLEIVDEMERLY